MRSFTKVFWLTALILIFGASSVVFAMGEIVGVYPYRDGNVGCAYDQTNNLFYVYHEAENSISKLDGTDYTLIDTWPMPFDVGSSGTAWSMTFDGTYLWLVCPWGALFDMTDAEAKKIWDMIPVWGRPTDKPKVYNITRMKLTNAPWRYRA